MGNTAWQVAVVGAGPVGLALALHAARLLPHAQITVFDARPAERNDRNDRSDRDVAADPRTLALSLGSVQFLQQLQAWAPAAAEPILQVHVSQAPPSLATPFGQAEVNLSAHDLGLPQLGAVLSYDALVAPLQRAWEQAVAAEPARLRFRLRLRQAHRDLRYEVRQRRQLSRLPEHPGPGCCAALCQPGRQQ